MRCRQTLEKLRTIPIVLDENHKVAPCACYHVSPEWLRGAGFDPRSGVTLWEKMSANNQNAPPEWMSTHPSGSSRIQEMQANMDKVLPLYQRAKTP